MKYIIGESQKDYKQKIYETEKAEIRENELGKDENSKVFIIARKNKVR